ncbi:CppA C-terminal domain-containing protein [Enterococcus sp. LJL98]
MSSFTLGKTATLETITIRVQDRDRMIDFYRGMIGFGLKQEENALAIMGVKGSPCEQIWLEESPRAYPHFGEMKKLMSFTLTVASMKELAGIYCRLLKADEEALTIHFYEDYVELTIVDPEENTLKIQAKQEEEKRMTPQALREIGDYHTPLTEKTKVTGVHLNVPNLEEATTFYQTILGLTPAALELAWTDTKGEQYLTPEDEVLGLDFLKFHLEEPCLLALESHLERQGQAFYIDKKKSILTVFDPLGVEWWFVRQQTK